MYILAISLILLNIRFLYIDYRHKMIDLQIFVALLFNLYYGWIILQEKPIWHSEVMDWECIVILIFKVRADVRYCSCNRAVKVLDHGMNVVKNVLERRLHRVVTVNEMQFGFMPERRTIDAMFVLRRLQEGYHPIRKS